MLPAPTHQVLATLSPALFNSHLVDCWTKLQLGRRIAVYRCLIPVTGSMKNAVYLSQLLYWYRHGVSIADHDGWLFKSIAEIEEETGLTKREQGVCKDKLMELGLIVTDRRGWHGKTALRVNLNAIAEAVLCHIGIDERVDLTLGDWRRGQHPILRNHFSKHIVYHRDAVRFTHSIPAAMMLSFLLHQCVIKRKDDRQHLYGIYTSEQWQRYLCLSYRNQLTARNRLKARNIIFEKCFDASRRIQTVINAPQILDLLSAIPSYDNSADSAVSKDKTDNDAIKTQKVEWAEPQTQYDQNQKRTSDKCANKVRSKPEIDKLQMRKLSMSKTRNRQVTNAQTKYEQNQKCTSNKHASTQVTNAHIVYRRDYNKFPYGNNYNYKPPTFAHTGNVTGASWGVVGVDMASPSKSKPPPSSGEAVTVKEAVQTTVQSTQHSPTQTVMSGHVDTQASQASRLDELIYPKRFDKTTRQSARKVLLKYLPDADTGQWQEILDEIVGQNKPVTSPMGLLVTLCKLAAKGELVCVFADQVQQRRMMEAQPPLPPQAALSEEELAQQEAKNAEAFAKFKAKMDVVLGKGRMSRISRM